MSAHRDRGVLLMQQGRNDLAADELRRALGDDPNDATSLGLLSIALCSLRKYDESEAAARDAIREAPDRDLGHYAMAAVMLARNRLAEAHRSALEAIRLDPEDCKNYSMMARVLIVSERWDDARMAAEEGLRFDATDVECINLRALALQQLGRRDDARAAIDTALAHDPENAWTHTTAGWAGLQAGDPKGALVHFKEALRIDPTQDRARAGIVEALKARHVVYAWMLKYFFLMGRLSPRARWIVILGGYFGHRALRALAKSNPDLAPWITPIAGLYLVFVFLTWTADPLFNLVLRLHPQGRLALSRDQVASSNAIGLVLLAALASGIWWFATRDEMAVLVAVSCLVLCIPVGATYSCARGWPRRAAAVYTLALIGIGIAALIAFWLAPAGGKLPPLVAVLGGVFGIGTIAAPWIATWLTSVSPRR